MYLKNLIALAATAAFTTSQAQPLEMASAMTTEDLFFAEIPVMLTPSRIEQPATALPMSVSVIDRSMIEASGAVNMAEVLRLVPGMQMTYVNGAYPLVTYHGLSDEWSRRLQVQIDGRSIYMPLFSSVDWTNQAVTLDDVERIEVIRGSNAPVYGSNAFIGVINIITRQPFSMQGGFVKFSNGSLDARSVGSLAKNGDYNGAFDESPARRAYIRYATAMGKWEMVGSLNYKTDQGFEYQDDSLNFPDGRTFDGMHDTQEITSSLLRVVYSPTSFDRIDMKFGLSGGEMNSGVGSEYFYPFTVERDRPVLSHYQSINWHHVMSSNQEVNVRSYHNYYEQHDNFDVGLVSDVMGVDTSLVETVFGVPDGMAQRGDNDSIAERYDLEFEYQLHDEAVTGINLVAGAGLRLDSIKSRWLVKDDGFIHDFSQRVFGNISWNATREWVLHGGAMLEHNSIIGTYVSPRVGTTYALNPYQALRFGVTRGVRTPSLLEANVYHTAQLEDGTDIVVRRIHSEDLKAEESLSYEMGYLTDFPTVNMLIDVKVFREEFEDLIYTAQDRNYPQPSEIPAYIDAATGQRVSWPFLTHNGTDATIQGFELQVKQKPTKELSVAFQYSWAKMEGTHLRYINADGSPSADPDGNIYEDIDAVPEHTVSALASLQLPWQMRFSTAYYRHSDTRWIGDGSKKVEGYNRWDFILNKSFRVAKTRGDVTMKLLNAFDEYVEFRKENVFRTRAYLDFSLAF